MRKTFNQQLLPFHEIVVQLHLPSIKRSILKSHHLKISEVRLFLHNLFILFLCPQDPKIDQKQKNSGRTEGSQDPPWDFNRPVVLNVSNLPDFVTWIKPWRLASKWDSQRRCHESLCGSRKKPRLSSMLIIQVPG